MTNTHSLRTRQFRAARTIFALMLREMSTTYGKSAMGYLWALIEPIAALTLMSVVFSLLLRQPPLGTNFPLFFASGFLMFQIYATVGNKVSTSIQFSRPLLEFPAVTPLDTIFARFSLNYITQIVITFTMIFGVIVFFDLRLHIDFGDVILAILMIGSLTLGVGTLNCYFFTAFPAYQSVWSILNRPMFILSGALFLLEDVPQPFRDLLWYNPLIHVIGKMRSGVYASYDPIYVSPAYVIGLGLLLFILGVLILRRNLRHALLK